MFNVAIRTAWTTTGSETLHLHAGGGITAYSTALGELREVGAKLAAFTQPIEPPTLFETIRVERGVAIRLERHLSRLAASADYFGVRFHRAGALSVLQGAIVRAGGAEVLRARLELAPDGSFAAWARTHDPVLASGLASVVFASEPVDRRDVRLYHKCADRTRYEIELAAAPDMFDVVLWNAEGEATELTRGNLVVELDGRRLTPPVDCGLLGGTLRSELLEHGEIQERILTLDDVRAAERLWFVNSLRGWVPIALAENGGRRAGQQRR
jgi:para-aminobenzoate synthetase/4-amino-4-deoxychorismate lyase